MILGLATLHHFRLIEYLVGRDAGRNPRGLEFRSTHPAVGGLHHQLVPALTMLRLAFRVCPLRGLLEADWPENVLAHLLSL